MPFSFLPATTLAQTTKITLPNPLNFPNPVEKSGILDPTRPGILWIAFGRSVMVLIAIAAVVMVLYAGFTWLTARGEKEKITTARDTLLWVVIGVVAVASAYVILKFVLEALHGTFMK